MLHRTGYWLLARGLVFGHLDQLEALICYLYQYFAFNLSLALSLLSSIIYLNMSAGMEYIFIIRHKLILLSSCNSFTVNFSVST